jgi:hypothetical protein
MKEGTCHAERCGARRGGLFLVENKQKQIPLPPELEALERSAHAGSG